MWSKVSNCFFDNIGTIIALASAVFAWSQARAAKKSLKMQKIIYNDGKANFEIDNFSNSFLYNDKKTENVYYFLKVNAHNLSDKNTSIHKIKLKLIGRDNSFIVEEKENFKIECDLERLKVPCNIQSHSSVNGWVVFEVPKSVYKELNIDNHIIIFEDIHGLVKEKEEISIMEKVIGYGE